METPVAQRRREANRQSARRHYHKKRVPVRMEEIERLRAEAAALAKQYSTNRPFLRYNDRQEDDVEASIRTLRRENTALRMRLDRFVAWERKLNVILEDRERVLAYALPSELSAMEPPRQKPTRSGIRLKKPLTVEECHAIGRRVYSEIVSFSSSGRDGLISTGASVFGWTDQRRVENGLLKFSISKLNSNMGPEEASASIWALLTAPNGFSKVISQSLNMHSEVVQVVDHSNVVILQESRVHSNAADGKPIVTVVRALVLLTLFATENGYVFADYALDPDLAIIQPNNYLGPSPADNVIVQHVWEPIFCWGTFERVEGAPHQCLSSFVGTFPVEGANYRSWAVEVLLLALRIDGYLIAPQWILPQEE